MRSHAELTFSPALAREGWALLLRVDLHLHRRRGGRSPQYSALSPIRDCSREHRVNFLWPPSLVVASWVPSAKSENRSQLMRHIVSLFFVALLMASGIAHGQTDTSTALEVYRVDAESSDIRLLIYRAGVLARLGHNHVISVVELEGRVYLHPNPELSSMEVQIPVDRLIVDDPVMRSEEGDGFSTELSKADINRTRANMLGRRLLNTELEHGSSRTSCGRRSARRRWPDGRRSTIDKSRRAHRLRPRRRD